MLKRMSLGVAFPAIPVVGLALLPILIAGCSDSGGGIDPNLKIEAAGTTATPAKSAKAVSIKGGPRPPANVQRAKSASSRD